MRHDGIIYSKSLGKRTWKLIQFHSGDINIRKHFDFVIHWTLKSIVNDNTECFTATGLRVNFFEYFFFSGEKFEITVSFSHYCETFEIKIVLKKLMKSFQLNTQMESFLMQHLYWKIFSCAFVSWIAHFDFIWCSLNLENLFHNSFMVLLGESQKNVDKIDKK